MNNGKLKKRVIEYYEDEEELEKEFSHDTEEFIEKDSERQIAYSIVLKADRPDLEKDTFESSVVEKMAHRFMLKFQDHNVEHEFDTEDVQVVESFLAPTNFELNGNQIKKNDWVMAVKFLDDDLWKMAKSGDLSGFSIEGKAKKIPKSEVQ